MRHRISVRTHFIAGICHGTTEVPVLSTHGIDANPQSDFSAELNMAKWFLICIKVWQLSLFLFVTSLLVKTARFRWADDFFSYGNFHMNLCQSTCWKTSEPALVCWFYISDLENWILKKNASSVLKMAKNSCKSTTAKATVRRQIELKQHKMSFHKKTLCTLRKKILHKLASKQCRVSVIAINPNYRPWSRTSRLEAVYRILRRINRPRKRL